MHLSPSAPETDFLQKPSCLNTMQEKVTFRTPLFSRSARTAEAAATMPQWPYALPCSCLVFCASHRRMSACRTTDISYCSHSVTTTRGPFLVASGHPAGSGTLPVQQVARLWSQVAMLSVMHCLCGHPSTIKVCMSMLRGQDSGKGGRQPVINLLRVRLCICDEACCEGTAVAYLGKGERQPVINLLGVRHRIGDDVRHAHGAPESQDNRFAFPAKHSSELDLPAMSLAAETSPLQDSSTSCATCRSHGAFKHQRCRILLLLSRAALQAAASSSTLAQGLLATYTPL